MDIVELSRKMEENLLETRPNKPTFHKSVQNENFTPRLTRSQSNKTEMGLIEEIKPSLMPGKNHTKVDEVEKVYLNKKVKVVHKNLETIYEDPIWKKGNTLLLGTSKVKRSIYLDREFRITSKQKSKLRKLKVKRLGKRLKSRKMTEEEFQSKMSRIEDFLNRDVEHCDVDFEGCDNEQDCDENLNNGSENKDLESLN